MEERLFCPNCGVSIHNPGRACPSCHEPLPAPKTVIGFAELPQGDSDASSSTYETGDDSLAATWNSAVSEPEKPIQRALVTAVPDPATALPALRDPGASSFEAAPPAATPPAQNREPLSVPELTQSPLAAISIAGAKEGSTFPGFPGAADPATIDPHAARPPDPIPDTAHPPPPQPAPLPAVAQPIAPQPIDPQQPIDPPPFDAQPVAPQQPSPAWGTEAPQLPHSPTEPHPGPAAAAMAPPAQPAVPRQPFVYGQPVLPVAAEPLQPIATEAPEPALSPTDTRKGLVWRTVAGGALLTWTLMFGLTASVFIVLHLALFLGHGFGNMHEITYATFGLAVGGLMPAIALLIASTSCLSGRAWPRALAVFAALTHVAWAGVTIFMLSQTFEMRNTASLGAVACGASAAVTVVWVVVLLAGGQWVSKTPPGKPARAVPYPLWAGPMLIVLACVSIVRDSVVLAQVGIKAAKLSPFSRAAAKVLDAGPLFWSAAAGWLLSFVLIVVGIGLLRRSRWSVGLGGAVGIILLLANLGAIVVRYAGSDLYRHGGPALAMVDVFIQLAFGIAAWVALAGALRFGFRLPRYLRGTAAQGPDGARLGLLEALVPRA